MLFTLRQAFNYHEHFLTHTASPIFHLFMHLHICIYANKRALWPIMPFVRLFVHALF